MKSSYIPPKENIGLYLTRNSFHEEVIYQKKHYDQRVFMTG